MERMCTGANIIDDILVSVVPKPLILTDVNDDCKIKIFEYLIWSDLLSIAESNKQLRVAVCDVFERKYGDAELTFDSFKGLVTFGNFLNIL